MAVPSEVLGLVERFRRNLETYKHDDYKETRVRVEFIDPFFEALGWDVRNVGGYAEQYKDVVHEAALSIGGKARAPDYSFRIGGKRKFFLEAKKPSVAVKGDVGPAYQLRRYSLSAELPLGILTDFEEFAVYDGRLRPKPDDKANVTRVLYLTYEEYVDRWDEIFDIFAKESVLKGSFDRYAQVVKKKRGTTKVDAEFLKEIEGWRDVLARNIALRNPGISVHELNFAVQRTIDRIVFLRIAEDRGIEPYKRLLALTNGRHIYQRMHDLYRQADEKYNAGLFDFQADTLTKTLEIDDKALKPILTGLYYPQSPYEFSVMPADVLGQVYEQFLGKVIRLTAGHRAKVEEKPEVKKAGGVYYTPTYIVEYIVKQTVGKRIEGKTPRQISKLRILDPACGSGSFLLGAYQHLLDHHLQYYETHDPKKHARKKQPPVYQVSKGNWRLTTAEKKRILLNNLYGVDIDRQAAEVTKLSLLLKVLEGETEETLGQQLLMWRQRALPHLGANIKCGNSLIGPDYFEGQLISDEDEMRRVNPFDWQAEFTKIMEAGGFDAVIGNPPYVRVHRIPSNDKAYYWDHYTTFVAKSDIYACFIERGIGLLMDEGVISFITPNTWASLESFTNLCRFIINNTFIEQLVRTPDKVFKNATVRTLIFALRRKNAETGFGKSKAIIREIAEGGEFQDIRWIAQKDMESSHLHNLLLFTEDAAHALFLKCTEWGLTFGTSVEFRYGFKTGDDKLFLTTQRLSDSHEPFVRSAKIGRYSTLSTNEFVDYRPEAMKSHRSTARPGDRARFERPKIVVARMGKLLMATLDTTGMFIKDAMLLLSPKDNVEWLKILTGILNSCLLQNLYQNHFATIDILKNALLALPLPKNIDHMDEEYRFDQLLSLVERMLELHKKLAASEIPDDKELYQRQIEGTDRKIDALVYELFGLTEEESRIVEEATSR
jgi:type I restriction-modification system DNA methylase subunit/predicted type IV restriction endonuclease